MLNLTLKINVILTGISIKNYIKHITANFIVVILIFIKNKVWKKFRYKKCIQQNHRDEQEMKTNWIFFFLH